MENQALLEKIEKHTRQQALFTKILCIICAVILLCMLALAGVAALAAGPVLELLEQAQFVLTNLDSATQDLAGIDFGSLMESMETLSADSMATVEAVVSKLEAIDLEALNQSIADLAEAVESMQSFPSFYG